MIQGLKQAPPAIKNERKIRSFLIRNSQRDLSQNHLNATNDCMPLLRVLVYFDYTVKKNPSKIAFNIYIILYKFKIDHFTNTKCNLTINQP